MGICLFVRPVALILCAEKAATAPVVGKSPPDGQTGTDLMNLYSVADACQTRRRGRNSAFTERLRLC